VPEPPRNWDLPPPDVSPRPRTYFVLDHLVPLVLALVGLGVLIAGCCWLVDPNLWAAIAVVVAGTAVTSIPLTILGMTLVGRFFEIEYGPLAVVVWKLLGILVFVDALWFLGWHRGYPVSSWVVLLPVSWALFVWLFRLSGKDAITSIFGLIVFRLAVMLVLVLAVRGPIERELERRQKELDERSSCASVNASARRHPGRR
jgi:hypothetical protein